jgi:hypothetical protein
MSEQELNDELIDGWWDVAKAGKWSGSAAGAPARIEVTDDDLARMAGDYDPAVQEAPVTVEHRHSGPAMGWVAALRVTGGVLQARFHRLNSKLREWLREGSYRSRSIEMYKPFEPTGRAYLAAVSFLGAQPPAVKGLSPQPSLLADGRGEIVSLTESECSKPPVTLGEDEMDAGNKGLAARAISTLRDVFSRDDELIDKDGYIVELEAKLEEERGLRLATEKRLAVLEQQLADLKQNEELEEFSAALAEAAHEQRITPAERAGYIRLGERLDRVGRAAILGELSGRRPLGMLAELSAPASDQKSAGELSRSRAAFEGFPEDPEHDAALKLMSAQPGLVFEEAIRRVRLDGGLA